MKKLNITKEAFNKSKYFQNKYGKLEYVSESGKVYKTNTGKLIKFVKESLDNPPYDDVEKEFNYKGIVITRYDYESLPDPMAATMMSDEQMQEIAKEMYFDLIDEGWTEQEIEQFSDVDEIADDDDKRETFQDSWWRLMEEEAINAGMKYYEDMDDDNEQLNESYDDIANDPAYQCPNCGGHNCEFDDANDPSDYFDGSTLTASYYCLDCGTDYDVTFELKVKDVADKGKSDDWDSTL